MPKLTLAKEKLLEAVAILREVEYPRTDKEIRFGLPALGARERDDYCDDIEHVIRMLDFQIRDKHEPG